MIKVIDLRSEYSTNPIFVNFNRQAYAIPTLYAKSLPKFESKQISTCLIILYPHDDFPEKPNIKGFADFYLYFNFDKYAVKDGIKPSLATLAKALGENKDIHIKIDGYTDFIGTEAYNLDLSVKRARAIKDFLISKGAIGSNISIEGYGEQNPADTNQTAAGRSRNRRVEFIISRG